MKYTSQERQALARFHSDIDEAMSNEQGLREFQRKWLPGGLLPRRANHKVDEAALIAQREHP